MIVLGSGLIMAVPGVNGIGHDDQEKPQQKQSQQDQPKQSKQSKQSKQRKPQSPASKPASAKQAAKAQQAKERRRISAHIASAYPRTRSLLSYLEKYDGRAFTAVLNHSAKITRRRVGSPLTRRRVRAAYRRCGRCHSADSARSRSPVPSASGARPSATRA